MIPILLIVGFVSVLGQVALLRELVVAFYGSELIYLLAVAFWMIGTGLGAFLARGSGPPGPVRVTLALVALGAALPGATLFARGLRLVFHVTPGAYLPFEQQAFAMAIAIAPVAGLIGLLFVWAARGRVDEGGSFAGAYGVESLGGLAGGIVSTFLVAGRIPLFGTALLTGAVAMLGAVIALRRSRLSFAPAFAAVALVALCLAAGGPLDRATMVWHFPGLLESRDTPYGRLTVTGRGGQVVLYENGALTMESQSTDPEELVHLALLQSPSPRRVLILGGGVSGTVREALGHGIESLDYVELNGDLIDLARAYFPADLVGPLDDPAVHVTVADGRRYMRGATGRYDAILIDMPEPMSGGTNRFYTREFFRECRAALREGGVMAFPLPSAEQVWTRRLALRNAGIYRSLASSFSDVVVLPGAVNLFIASNRPLAREPSVIIDRWEERSIASRLVSPGYIEYLYTNDRFAEIDRVLRTTRAPANSDERPVCYPFTILLWLARFYRPLADWRPPGTEWIWGALPALFLLFLPARRRPLLSSLVLVAIAGFAGIVIEFAVLLRFQTACGVLYRDMGLLFAGFMAGLAISPLAGRPAARWRRGGIWLAVFLALFAALTSLFFRVGGAGNIAAAFLCLVFGGIGVGAVYCHAAEKRTGNGPELYAADLLGGSLGALLGALILLPAAGPDAAVLWAAALLILAVPLASTLD